MLENATYKNLFLIIQESIAIIKKGGGGYCIIP